MSAIKLNPFVVIALLAAGTAVLLPGWREVLVAQGYYDYEGDLVLDLDAVSEPIIAGGSVSVDVSASNRGPDRTEATAVVSSLDPALTVGDVQGCDNADGAPVCELGVLDVDETRPVSYLLNIDSGATGNVSVDLIANSDTAEGEPGDEAIHLSRTLTYLTDVTASLDNGTSNLAGPGTIELEYVFTVSNPGFSDGDGILTSFQPPQGFMNMQWLCYDELGSNCGTAGSDPLDDVAAINADHAVVYIITGSIDVGGSGSVSAEAQAFPAEGIADPDFSNNVVEDVDPITQFASSFEDNPAPTLPQSGSVRRSTSTGQTDVLSLSRARIATLTAAARVIGYGKDDKGRLLTVWLARRDEGEVQVRGMLTASRGSRFAETTPWLALESDRLRLATSWQTLDDGEPGVMYSINGREVGVIAQPEPDPRAIGSRTAVNGQFGE